MNNNPEPISSRRQPVVSAQLQHKLDRYFVACSAGIGASLAVVTGGGTEAKADIIYSGTKNIAIPAINFQGIYFDFDSTASGTPTSTSNIPNVSDANLFDTYGVAGTSYFYHAVSFFGPNKELINNALATLTTTNGETLKLSAGFMIGPSPSMGVFGQQNDLANRKYDYYTGTPGPLTGQWASGGTGFLGFRFVDANGQTDFGWMRINFDPTNFTNQQISTTVIDWAYNNSGGPIAAGQIPEPSAIALALLGAGAVGLAVWRQRRQQNQATPEA